jgi:hypothetical protein
MCRAAKELAYARAPFYFRTSNVVLPGPAGRVSIRTAVFGVALKGMVHESS